MRPSSPATVLPTPSICEQQLQPLSNLNKHVSTSLIPPLVTSQLRHPSSETLCAFDVHAVHTWCEALQFYFLLTRRLKCQMETCPAHACDDGIMVVRLVLRPCHHMMTKRKSHQRSNLLARHLCQENCDHGASRQAGGGCSEPPRARVEERPNATELT